ncbi:MAG: GTPase [Planctomycetota bacterium]|nr:GTPase [Planctomycetota bacterium]
MSRPADPSHSSRTGPGAASRSSPSGEARCRFLRVTAPSPGAIAIIQILGDVEPILAALTGIDGWPVGPLRLTSLGGIDDGFVCRAARDVAELMPHGGRRVVQRLIARLRELGAGPAGSAEADPRRLYPEARDAVEALMLEALAAARSPLAVNLLLDQPRRWRARPVLTAEDEARSRRLNRLIEPPVVVLAGPPNVGKSTLSNALLGRTMSITLDEPATTRDYTAGLIDLAGLVVRWYDTAGLRDSADPIESKAIELARGLMAEAELLIAMTDASHGWPNLTRQPDLRIAGRIDLGRRVDGDLSLCTPRGEGVAELAAAVLDRLVPPADLVHPGPWRFDPRL